MNRFPILAIAWTALLVAGFAIVLTLGGPVGSSVDELEVAMHPATPVTQEAATSSAATIVRLGYPAFRMIEPSISQKTDFGIDHWVVEYTDTSGSTPTGLRISIVVDSGTVEVTTFP